MQSCVRTWQVILVIFVKLIAAVTLGSSAGVIACRYLGDDYHQN